VIQVGAVISSVAKKISILEKIIFEIKKTFGFIFQSVLLSLSKKGSHVFIGSPERKRYLKYYISSKDTLIISCSRPILLFFIPLLCIRVSRNILISDIYFRKSEKYRVLASILRFYKCQYLIWNDELELAAVPESIRHSITVKSFFAQNSCEILKPLTIISRGLGRNSHPIKNSICFIGQANPEIYSTDLRKHNISPDYIFSNYLNLTPSDIFALTQIAPESELPIALRVKIRHQYINLWRKLVVRDLCRDFNRRVILVGPDFLTPEFSSAERYKQLNVQEVLYLYSHSRVCLDLGSQCGVESLYPRSLEIISENPSGLVQVALDNSVKLFSGTIANHVSKNYQEMASNIDYLLDMKNEQYVEDGRIILRNAEIILFSNSN